MAITTIEWTTTIHNDIKYPGYTFNPWWGCEKVSPACRECYAENLDRRWNGNHWGPNSDRKKFGDKHWNKPLFWNAYAQSIGTRLKVFCASMADVFEDNPQVETERIRLWKLIEDTPWLNWLILTKRPQSIIRFLPKHWLVNRSFTYTSYSHQPSFPSNIWIGTSYEKGYSWRIEELMKVPAPVRFLSIEPLYAELPPIFEKAVTKNKFVAINRPHLHYYEFPGIDWIIVGGESGNSNRIRRMQPEWVRSIRDNCLEAGVPFFFKQWGQFNESGEKVGKHNSGRILDGRTWDEMPLGIST